MKFYWLALGTLTVWRVTHMLRAEDGPGDMLARLRRRAGEGLLGKLLDCFYCLSVWIALPASLFLGESWQERAWLWPALSAAAILLERATTTKSEFVGIPYVEDPKSTDGLLRATESDPPTEQTPPTER